ncbi:Amino-acid acetyltransferase, mitochondrial [Coemansia sp. BCRC 34301]|nr:Amino-acid acetyltransferase, mitochondrial [Coemansia sp. BCRC 34301]
MLARAIRHSSSQSHARTRELILSVLSTVPSPREARKFLDSVSGRETLLSRREFEEQQAKKALTLSSSTLVPGEFLLQPHVGFNPSKLLAALVCVDSRKEEEFVGRVAKLLALMQRIGVVPVVVPLESEGHLGAVSWSHAMANAVDCEGGRARPICQGVFTRSASGIVAEGEPITAAVSQGQIPIVAPLVADAGQRLRVVDTQTAGMPALARALAAGNGVSVTRVILLGQDAYEAARLVNLEEDYERHAKDSVFQLMRTCLRLLPPTAAGIVAGVSDHPGLVLKGLISERPAGSKRGAFTLLRHGFRIQRHMSLASCDESRLRFLLETSFGRPLDATRYFERLRETPVHIIVAGDYQGAVIVTYEPTHKGSLAYLDKFAVLPGVQGTGMADILWDELRLACPDCLWRSRADNGVNPWYFDRSSGHARGGKWVFFWYRARDSVVVPKDVVEGIRIADSIPPSFK